MLRGSYDRLHQATGWKPEISIEQTLTDLLLGRSTDRLASAVLSTAEAVSVAHAMGVYAYYYRDGVMQAEDFTDFLVGAVVKNNVADLKRINHYFESEVALRKEAVWQIIYQRWRKSFRY